MTDNIWQGRDFLVLDGSMGQMLKSRGIEVSRTIWSAEALMTAPDVVRDLHAEYLHAGADILTTNNYACVPSCLVLDGIEDRLDELVATSVRLACEARDLASPEALIAGALPPLSISYRPDVVLEPDEGVPIYTRIIAALGDEIDLLVAETMSSIAEAQMMATAARVSNKPLWLSWTLADDGSGKLRSGETVTEAFAALKDHNVAAWLFNCCVPKSIDAALPELLALTGNPVGAYANAFLPVPEGWSLEAGGIETDHELDPWAYERHARHWLGHGARIIGGCCDIGPDHIARIRALVPRAA